MPIWGLWKMSEPILKIEDLQVNYGGIEAVKGISFEVQEGQIVTLIGSNGAGQELHAAHDLRPRQAERRQDHVCR